MKKIFLFTAITIALVVSSLCGCRKDDKKDLNPDYNFLVSDCDNGFQDGTETGVDCGGICWPCQYVDFSCNQAINSISWDGSNLPTSSTNIGGNIFTIHPSGGGVLYFEFWWYPFPMTGPFRGSSSVDRSGKVYFKFKPPGSSYWYESYDETGSLQVTYNGSSTKIQGCNLKLSLNGGISYTLLNLNVNCY